MSTVKYIDNLLSVNRSDPKHVKLESVTTMDNETITSCGKTGGV